MVGFYNYTVWPTYAGMASSVIGITLAAEGKATLAVACLMLSGLLDSIDGMVARTKKDRTDREKRFGIQIDSLCDMVCFGVFPAFLSYTLGVDGLFGKLVLAFYCGCGVIRLAYFNVLEEEQFGAARKKRCYHGMPITFMSAIFPLAYLMQVWLSADVFAAALHAVLIGTGLLYIIDFPFPRPRAAVAVFLMLLDNIALGLCFWFGV